MVHYMNLHPRPFMMIAERKKTIELRLMDDKRKRIVPGDSIIFTSTADAAEKLTCVVKQLHMFESFAALYAALPLERCGYLPEELETASPADMEQYYSPEMQKEYGVVGIELKLIKEC